MLLSQMDLHRSAGSAHRELVERVAVMDGGRRYVTCGRDGTAKCGLTNRHHGNPWCYSS